MPDPKHATGSRAATLRALLGMPADYPADLLPWRAVDFGAQEERSRIADEKAKHGERKASKTTS